MQIGQPNIVPCSMAALATGATPAAPSTTLAASLQPATVIGVPAAEPPVTEQSEPTFLFYHSEDTVWPLNCGSKAMATMSLLWLDVIP